MNERKKQLNETQSQAVFMSFRTVKRTVYRVSTRIQYISYLYINFELQFLRFPHILILMHILLLQLDITVQWMQGSTSKRLNMIGEHIKSQALVKYQTKNSLLTITLNRPKALNSLNLEMVENLSENYDYVNKHAVAWFQGAGGKSFCAGGDVKVLFEKGSTVQSRLTFFKKQFTLDYKIANLKALQISCWDGIVMGGGVGLSAFAPFIIATEKTVFAMPEVKIGFYTDVGSAYILARMRNNIGYYLGMTGNTLKGEQVFIAGLANYFIPSNKLQEVYDEVVKISTQKHQNLKNRVAAVLQKYHVAPKAQQIADQEEIKHLFGFGSSKAIYQQALKQKSQFQSKIVKVFKSVCPASVELVYRLITMTKNMQNMTLRQVLIHDYMILEHMATNPDFNEGVRCVLIQKGSTPKWSSEDLLSLKEESVAYFFKPIVGSQPLEI